MLNRGPPLTAICDVPLGDDAFNARRFVRFTTCGASRASSIGFPPRCGNSCSRRESMNVPIDAVPDSSNGAVPLTSTDEIVLPLASGATADLLARRLTTDQALTLAAFESHVLDAVARAATTPQRP